MSAVRGVLLLVAVALAVILVIVLVRPPSTVMQRTPEQDCALEFITYSQKVRPLMDEWRVTFDLARYSSRLLLPTYVPKFRDIRQRIDSIDEPSCLMVAHVALLMAVDDSEQLIMAILGDKPESELKHWVGQAEFHLNLFDQSVDISTGATPTPSGK